jgi:hypothetical protein
MKFRSWCATEFQFYPVREIIFVTKSKAFRKPRANNNLNPIKKTKMTQTVHDNFFHYQNRRETAGFGNNKTTRRFFLTFLVALVSYAGMAQTYTTKAPGAWNSSATWVGGSMPGTSIGAGKTVIVKHAVSFTQQSDLTIAGTLNIEGDSLKFDNTFSKKVIVTATGAINVKNGGFIQALTKKGDLDLLGGRLILENARFLVGGMLKATAGSKKSLRNSTLIVGSKYHLEGTSSSRGIDSLITSTVESVEGQGNFDILDYCTLYVDNARLIIGMDKLKINPTSAVTVLPGAAGNYGFKLLKINGDLQNDGPWNARIDAFCISGAIVGTKANDVDFTRPEDCSVQTAGPAPELSFVNPVLIKGTANKEGAEYLFSNITTGVDAVIKLKKFSRSTIVMKTIDNNTLGWNKAFQPEFGLPGVVPPNQDWYIDFEMTFYEAGKNKKMKVQKVDLTALDVDGDGWSISEYAIFSNPAGVAYSPSSSLSTLQAGSLGSSILCATCNVSSVLAQCLVCKGSGEVANTACTACAGHGALHSGCSHPYEGMIGNILQGPVQNFNNIDTNGTAVMATYQYSDVDRINFRYGAKSGAYSSNGSGIRLNSLWSKSFNLTPWTALPVNFSSFTVMLDKADASLTWKSQAGEELSHFVVQRSTDGKNFTDIATVFPDKSTAYAYTDKAVSSATGVVYYRVASVDFTREQQFTAIKQLRLAKNELSSLAIATYPNPVVNNVSITLPHSWQGKPVMLQLITANGTIAKSVQLGSAGQTETMPVGGLTKGLYIVKAVCGEESAQQRVVKQ